MKSTLQALKNAFKQPLPSYEIIRWYKEAGGKIITLGSDSHTPEHPGFYFKDVLKELKSIGFDSICTFENMKTKFSKNNRSKVINHLAFCFCFLFCHQTVIHVLC